MYKISRFTPFLYFSFLLLSFSCTKRIHPTTNQNFVIYPSPPDTARIQFLTRYSNSSDLERKTSKFKDFIVGEEKILQIIKPYGIAVHNHQIFICDFGIEGLEILNLENGTLDYFIPRGRGKLQLPRNCFINNGILYVADPERGQVVIFDENLEYSGEISGSNFEPSDVEVMGDTIFVTDPKNNRITAYNKASLELLFTFPENAVAGEKKWLYNPQNLAVTESFIYVSDFGDPSVKIFNRQGDYISSIGSYGRSLGQFTRSKGIAIDNDENIYVVDAGFENIQIFSKEGDLLLFFGGPYQGPGDMYLPADVSIDYNNLDFYKKYVDANFELKYLIFVTNQYGPDKVSIYGRIEPK